LKTKTFHAFKSVWANMGYCPDMGQHNPCTGTAVVFDDVTPALSEPAFCIARGKETPVDIVLLTE
jgi:hypothetical protein